MHAHAVPIAAIIFHVLNSHILPCLNLSAPVSRKPEDPVSSLLISASYPEVDMNPMYVFMCVSVCVFVTQRLPAGEALEGLPLQFSLTDSDTLCDCE